MIESTKLRVAILTAGGDAPGMNAAIRSITRTAIANGLEVVGIYEGYKGLMENNMKPLDEYSVCNIVNRGGTVLYTERCKEFESPEGVQRAVEVAKSAGINGIICIGGDGTFKGARDLSNAGLPCIGVTGTIDNDISSSDYTVGFDTAKNTVVEFVDSLRDTCESHARCNVVEVMGRHAGYIAVETAIACGATGCFVKEFDYDKEALFEKIKKAKAGGKRGFIVIISEGMKDLVPDFGELLAKEIDEKTGVETKFARIAHAQRGGNPTLIDRVMAARMGAYAVQLFLEGKSNVFVTINNDVIGYKDIEWAIAFDEVYKGKIKPEKIAALGEETYAELVALAEQKRAKHFELYKLADSISI